jgi:hypothetical protein
MARSAVTGAIWLAWCPIDDLEVNKPDWSGIECGSADAQIFEH